MYYNENEYYDAYRKNYTQESKKQKLSKVFLSILAFMLFIASVFYLYRYFNPIFNNEENLKEALPKTTQTFSIKEEKLPKSIQLQTENTLVSSINKEDIEHIVNIIMLQMNQEKEKEKNLEKQFRKTENKISKITNF